MIIGGDSEVWTRHDAACTLCLVLVEPQGTKNIGTVAGVRKNFGKTMDTNVVKKI